jgi:asparagine synthase (glutamine-hydrolysing)
MFAFALWDPSARRLLLARDRVGIKPIYFYRGDGLLLFASEVRALLATGLVPRRLDATALWQFLGYQSVPAPRSLVNGVSALEPGRWMTVDQHGQVITRQYWNMLDAARDPIDVGAEEAQGTIGDLLRDAVSSHMISDVPVGAFLSGGIDSSAIVALMRETGHTARTFSVGFDEQQFDESAHAALIAERFHTEHTHIPLSGKDLLGQLPMALAAMDQPTGDAVNTYVVSGAVRARGMTVAQSGLGGDEVFGGYPSFARLSRVADLTRLWGKSPDGLRSLAASAVRSIGGASIQASKAAAVLESDGSIASMFPVGRQLLSEEQRVELLTPAGVAAIADRSDPYVRLLTDAFAEAPESGVIARISFSEARTYMHDVLLRDTDQMSMAHSLEVRVPLLDHRLIEYVMSLPERVKQPGTTPKALLVNALDGLLPESIWNRPKQGFALPFDPWMKGPLRAFCEHRLGDAGLSGSGLFNVATIRAMWGGFLEGRKTVSWSRLWTLVVLGDWLERHALAP